MVEAYREIIPTVLRQAKDPTYYIQRPLPTPAPQAVEPPRLTGSSTAKGGRCVDGWIEVCPSAVLQKEDVIRFDLPQATFAIYRTADDRFYATDGICTHGNAHLADGLVQGTLIECAKHNGRFDIRDGSPQRPPVCVAIKTYVVQERQGSLWLDLTSAGGLGVTAPPTTYTFRVVSNENIATFIKELVLELDPDSPALDLPARRVHAVRYPGLPRSNPARRGCQTAVCRRLGRPADLRPPRQQPHALPAQLFHRHKPGQGPAAALQRAPGHPTRRPGLSAPAWARPMFTP